MLKIKKGDTVKVIAGKDKGKKSTVLQVIDNSVNTFLIVEGVNMIKKHVKANPNSGEKGGIVEQEARIHISNVAFYNTTSDQIEKVGFKTLADGKMVRFGKKSNQDIL
jgi:large subunit ribosomal protein L24